MKRFVKIFLCLQLIGFFFFSVVWIGASSGAQNEVCVKWATPTPTLTPIRLKYTEFIPYPGTRPNSGYGWINVQDFYKMRETPNRKVIVPILTDKEYNDIAKEHGLRISQAGRIVYGFSPVQGFPRSVFGGPILKKEWLPKRLQLR